MIISSICLLGFGLARSFLRVRMKKSSVRLGGEGGREEKKLQEVAGSVGDSHSVTARLWILIHSLLLFILFTS